MFRRILSRVARVAGGGRRTTARSHARGRTTRGTRGSTNEIERGVRSLFRGVTRRRRRI